MTDQKETARMMAELIRKKYITTSLTEEDRFIDGALKLILLIHEEKIPSIMMNEAAKTVHRIFGFNEVCVGVRSPEDGKFRYEAIIGGTREVEKNLRTLAFDLDQMGNCKEYPGVQISRYSEFNLREYETHKVGIEEKCYTRPLALRDQRKSPDDMIEGDYIDVYIYAEKDNMIGWVEVSRKRDDKFPSRTELKWLEFYSALIGLGIRNLDLLRGRKSS